MGEREHIQRSEHDLPPEPTGAELVSVAWCVVLGEALAQVLDGRPTAAAALLDAACDVAPRAPHAALDAAVLLTRLQLAEVTGRHQQRQALEMQLEAQAAAAGPHLWSLHLQRARASRRAGDIDRAMDLLRAAVADFRRAAESLAPPIGAVARSISREVGRLELHDARIVVPAAGASARADDPSVSVNGLDLLLGFVHWGQRLFDAEGEDQVIARALDGAMALVGADLGFVVRVEGDATQIVAGLDAAPEAQLRSALSRARPLCLQAAVDGLAEFAFDVREGVSLAACIPIDQLPRGSRFIYVERGEPFGPSQARLCRLLEQLGRQTSAAVQALRKESRRPTSGRVSAPSLTMSTSVERRTRFMEMVGSSPAMQSVYRHIETVIPSPSSVLILGETGTGKELVARLIHRRGTRAQGPFVAVNCAAMQDTLLESELFGVEPGAFTGAEAPRPGRFEQAHLGTMFLDEIGEMSPRMQAALLRVLQTGEVQRVGGQELRHVDVRVLAATHRDLSAMVRQGSFRADLLYRLDVLRVPLPPLRDRLDDLPLLIDDLFRRHAPDRYVPTIDAGALQRLREHAWPGNVRELENLVQQWITLKLEVVSAAQLPADFSAAAPRTSARSLHSAEAEAIRAALTATKGNRTAAARILGIDRKTLFSKLRRLEGSG